MGEDNYLFTQYNGLQFKYITTKINEIFSMKKG